MAGSYGHIVGKDGGFRGVDLIDNLGDAYEALEECYGMIWWLAQQQGGNPTEAIGQAEEHYKDGLAMSPTRRT